MKLKLIALLALSATICLSSCKKDDDHTPDPLGGDNAVILKLDLPGGATRLATRVEGTITTGTPPAMQKVDIYLYDQQTGIVYDAQSLSATQLTAATTAAGLQITNLHANVDAIAVVCNDTPTKGLNVAESALIGTLFAKEVNIALEQDFANLTYIGTDESLAVADTPEGGSAAIDYFNAAVTVAPLVARVELSNIAVEVPRTINWQYLILKSVFVEDVYKDGIRLDYLTNFASSNPSPVQVLEAEAEGNAQYWYLEVLEAPNTETGAYINETAWSPKYGTPPVDGVFAFHIFQNTGNVPTLGLHLDTQTADAEPIEPKYVRFNSYASVSEGDITGFEAGHIYKIRAEFAEGEVTDHDEDGGEVSLVITVEDWTIHDDIVAGQ